MLDVTLKERKEVKEEKKVKNQYDWRYENSIVKGKRVELENNEFKYSQWRTNSSLSNYPDTVMDANMMNIVPHVSDQMHYDYLYYSTRKANRYSKPLSKEDKKQKERELELYALISDYYKYNNVRVKEALKILSEDQIDLIRKKQEKGGLR